MKEDGGDRGQMLSESFLLINSLWGWTLYPQTEPAKQGHSWTKAESSMEFVAGNFSLNTVRSLRALHACRVNPEDFGEGMESLQTLARMLQKAVTGEACDEAERQILETMLNQPTKIRLEADGTLSEHACAERAMSERILRYIKMLSVEELRKCAFIGVCKTCRALFLKGRAGQVFCEQRRCKDRFHNSQPARKKRSALAMRASRLKAKIKKRLSEGEPEADVRTSACDKAKEQGIVPVVVGEAIKEWKQKQPKRKSKP